MKVGEVGGSGGGHGRMVRAGTTDPVRCWRRAGDNAALGSCQMRALISMLFAGVVLAACSPADGPGGPIPSYNIPPIPPIDPSSIGDGIPTLPPGGSTTGACALVTEAEMSTFMGQTMTVYSNSGTQCSWISAAITPSVIIRYDSGESIDDGRRTTPNGRDLVIGGYPAYYGEFAGSLLYIEKAGRVLVVQTVWDLAGDEGVQTVGQIGEIAVSRF